ncbi:MAG: hypothetical protein NWE93_04515 [Candidatus Bathyarchaeota archaeon]|nr:hypothetical protein [Candidatus Bathyarchaeota archaeon]
MEQDFKARVVALILAGNPEEALVILAEQYKVKVPALRVGLPKRHKHKAYGCYTAQTQTISVLNSEVLLNPFVILHEFYHHLRSKAVDMVHRGTERGADQFALEYILAYKTRSSSDISTGTLSPP